MDLGFYAFSEWLGVDLVTLAFDEEDVTGAEYIVDFGSASPYMAKPASLMPAPLAAEQGDRTQ